MPLKRKQGGQVVGFDTGVTRGWGWLFGNGAQVWLMQNYKLLVKKLIAYPRAITAAIQRQLEPRDIKKKTLLVACMMAVPHQNTAPAQSEYAGDEVSAIVLDPGYSTTRAGFAGEDTPKSIVPTYYGVLESADSGARHLFGDNAIHNPLANFEIKHPMSNDGIVEDWDVAQKLWEYSITSRLTGAKATQPSKNGLNDPSNGDGDVDMESTEDTERPIEDSPLLMTEPGWNSAKAREKTIEIAIEDWGCPAFYMQKTGVLAAFASGRATALVIDVGASMTSVTPVIDGMVLKKGVQRAPIGGNFVSQQIRLALAQAQPPAPLTPHFMVASKTPVDAGAAAQATYRKFDTPPTASFRRFQEERVLTEFKESVVQVWAGPGRLSNGQNEELAKTHPGRPFEMPDGWNQVFGLERYKVVEGLFDAKAALTDADTPKPRDDQTIPALINAALNAADVDYRPPLLSNIVVTGGSSLLWQFNDRLTQEIQTMFPAPRFRIQAAGNTVERKYGAWIGGSVLASLGSFHQNWISKKEYEEHGAAIVEKRCK